MGRQSSDVGADLSPSVDPTEFFGHQQSPSAESVGIKDGPHGLAYGPGCRSICPEINPDSGPSDAYVHVGFIFGQPGANQRNAKAHGLIDASIAAVCDEYVGSG
jgi:hypothetical protein